MTTSAADEVSRRRYMYEVLERFNSLVEKEVFSRQHLFGGDLMPESWTHWSRGIMARLYIEGYVDRGGHPKHPWYRALAPISLSEESITDWMGTTTRGLPPVATQVQREIQVAVADQPSPSPALPPDQPVPAVEAAFEQGEPTTDEMLRALVGVLPQMVEAIHRVEVMVSKLYRELGGKP